MNDVFVLVESNTSGTGPLFAAAARRRGAEPVLVTAAAERYPWAAREGLRTVPADTDDDADVVRAAAAAAGGRAPAGILSSSEYFVATAAAAAQALGLPGPDPVAVAWCRDKERQRAVLRGAGVPIARGGGAASEAAAVDLGDYLGYPVVAKPVDGTGSRGVRLCPDRDSLSDHARALLSGGPDERGRPGPARIVVEEFVGGPEVSVETFGPRVVTVVDKHLGPLPWFVEYGHDLPSALPPALHAAAAEAALAAVGALGLGWGPAHVEIRLAPAGPVVIEVNPRLAGGWIPLLARLAGGVDLVQATVDLALGWPAVPPVMDPGGAAAIRFLVAPVAGQIREVRGRAHAETLPGVVDVAISVRPGDCVGGTGSFLDRLGWVIATGLTAGAAAEAAEAGLAAVAVETRPRTQPDGGRGPASPPTSLAGAR